MLVPWYAIEDGFFTFEWLLDGYPFDSDYAPAIFLLLQGEKLWLAPLLAPLALPVLALRRQKTERAFGIILIVAGAPRTGRPSTS